MAETAVNRFPAHLAANGHVTACTQNKALSATLLLCEHVLQLARIKGLIRARRPKRLPVLLTAGELSRLMARLGAQKWPTAMLMHGAGLQLLAAARLRFKELDCQRRESKLREGKVDKDRLTTMATAVVRPLQEHLGQVRTVHRRYMAHGFGRVEVPHALARKFPNAERHWYWQRVFPKQRRLQKSRTGQWGASPSG